MPTPRQRYYNNNGSVASGCKLYLYEAGTSTPKAAYTDAAGTVPHAHPITLDTKGEVLAYFSGAYKVDLKTAAGVQITGYPVDNFVSIDSLVSSSVDAFEAELLNGTGTGIGVKRTLPGAIATTLQKWIDGQVVNVKAEYCADGVYTAAKIQSAINDRNAVGATGCGVVFLAAGTWDMSANGGLTGYSNLTLAGEGDATVLDCSAQTSGNIFTAAGTYGTEIAISAEIGRYAKQVSTATNHGAAVDDWYAIKSQRNSLSSDGGDWQLGIGTAGISSSYYTEIFQITNVVDADTADFAPSLVFPKYRPDATQETDPNARASATIAKIDWVEGIVIRDMRVIAGAGSNRISLTFAKDCLVENVKFDMRAYEGVPLYFKQTYMCLGRGCKAYHAANAPINDVSKPLYNTFKIISGWYSGFENCESTNGSQPIDITYTGGANPSLFCYANSNVIANSIYNPITTHSGAYGFTCIGNQLLNSQRGPALRSRNTIFSGNTITGQGGDAANKTYGLSMTDGWIIDSIITNNTIEGFYYAIFISDFNSLGTGFVERKTQISGNHLSRCAYGIYYNHDDVTYKTTSPSGLAIRNNMIIKCNDYGIYIDKYVNNVIVEGNTLYGPMGPTGTPYAIYFADDSAGQIVRNNQLLHLGANVNGIRLGDIADTVTFPAVSYPTPLHVLSQNNFYGLRNADFSGTFVSPNTVFFGNAVGARTYAPNTGTSMLHECGVAGQSMVWSQIIDRTSTGWFAVGDQDAQLQGGFNYSNATDILTIRTGGTSQVTIKSTSVYPSTDNARTLGEASFRWSTVYAATGAINTSDERAKDQIQDIDEAVIRAAHKIDFKQFKFRDAVAVKGGDARWHFGAIAQQVQAAFESEGLDAFAYGLLCYDEWPELPELRDEDGNITQEYRAAGNRYGVRYDELLCLKMASL